MERARGRGDVERPAEGEGGVKLAPYYDDGLATIYLGDCREVLVAVDRLRQQTLFGGAP